MNSQSATQLAEEFVVGPIKHLHRYVTAIELRCPNFQLVRGHHAIQLFDLVNDYCTRHAIHLSVDRQYAEAVTEIQRIRDDEE